MAFYNPYHFIPATANINGDNAPTFTFDYTGNSSNSTPGASDIARHDLHHKQHHSGRVVCSLQINTPTIVGNQSTKLNPNQSDSPTQLDGYQWNNQPAIPANSLRGMVASIIEAISQSSLRVLEEPFWNFFSEISKDLPPFNAKRNSLTAAELMFGVVQINTESNKNSRSVATLASRVKFADAVLAKYDTADTVLVSDYLWLHEQGKPKADGNLATNTGNSHKTSGPTHYFKDSDNKPVNHDTVARNLTKNEAQLVPMGRKQYLPHDDQKTAYRYSGSQHARKTKCRPIKAGTLFYFHIDFFNLTTSELSLLRQSLEPSDSDSYFHKIGLGKSMGMGQVKVKISDIFLQLPDAKYSTETLTQSAATKYQQWYRFHQLDQPGWTQLARYNYEQQTCDALSASTLSTLPFENSYIDQQSLQLVQQFGSTKSLNTKIDIRWRRGHLKKNDIQEEPPSSLADVLPDHQFPKYGTTDIPSKFLSNLTSATGDKHGILNPHAFIKNYSGVCGEWIIEQVRALNNMLPWEDLSTRQIRVSLSGTKLADNWNNVTNNELKAELADYISKSTHPFDWNSRRGDKAKAVYINWLDQTGNSFVVQQFEEGEDIDYG